jgi:hypothetical protein
MALTEETAVDKIEVVGDYSHVQVRTATIIKKHRVRTTPTKIQRCKAFVPQYTQLKP